MTDMSREKKLAPNSFQERVVNFLKENSSKHFTAREILEEINKNLDKAKSDGSMSGTLAVLHKDGWVAKSNEYPARYSYHSEYSNTEPTTQTSATTEIPTTGKQSSSDTSQNHLLHKISRKISDIRNKISNIDNKIDELQKERGALQAQLDLAEDLLSQGEG